MKQRVCFWKRFLKIDKTLASLTKKKRERTQINKIKKWKRRNKNWYNRDTHTQQQQQKKKKLREYYKQLKLYANKLGQPRRNGHISRNIKPAKTKSGRNRQYEQTDHQ